MDTVFVVAKPQILTAMYDCSEYFDFDANTNEQTIGIKMKESKRIEDLEFRFMGRLPREIFEFLMEKVQEYAEVA